MGPASIEVWISVAGAVEDAGIDEADALERLLDAGLEVDGGAAFLVMMPTLRVFSGNDSIFSTRANSSQVSATSSGPCSFGLTI